MKSAHILGALARRVQGNRPRKALAFDLGLTPSELARWITGEVLPPRRRIRGLAEALVCRGCPPIFVHTWVRCVHAEWADRIARDAGYAALLEEVTAICRAPRAAEGGR